MNTPARRNLPLPTNCFTFCCTQYTKNRFSSFLRVAHRIRTSINNGIAVSSRFRLYSLNSGKMSAKPCEFEKNKKKIYENKTNRTVVWYPSRRDG